MKAQTLMTVIPGYLTIAASNFDARPMSYLSQEGERLGYEPDLARAVCDLLKLKPIWHNLPMADFTIACKQGIMIAFGLIRQSLQSAKSG
jgi:ABC-type amino acid transport substrate-binding protein